MELDDRLKMSNLATKLIPEYDENQSLSRRSVEFNEQNMIDKLDDLLELKKSDEYKFRKRKESVSFVLFQLEPDKMFYLLNVILFIFIFYLLTKQLDKF